MTILRKRYFLLNLRKIIFQVFVFLLPTQLAFHLWPNWSHIFGIRIDYLSPAIYFTDLLVALLVGIYLLSYPKLKQKKNSYLFLILFSLFALLNINFSLVYQVALYRWIKMSLFGFLAYLISRDEDLSYDYWIVKPLCFSIIFFTLIGIFQVVQNKTLGGIFYFFGERTFNASTPGISLMNFFGGARLRAYSTFSHPNSFAGFLAVSFPLLFFWKAKKKLERVVKQATLILVPISLVLTCSLGSLIALTVVIFFIFNKKISLKRVLILTVGLTVFLSLLAPVLSEIVMSRGLLLSANFQERLMLAKISGQVVSKHPFLGLGLNNFINAIPIFYKSHGEFWFLHPVHNIFLLLTAEIGFLGLIGFFSFLARQKFFLRKKELVLALLTIVLTGLFDHYWLTLQQNVLLLFLILGLSLNKKIK